MHDIHLAIFRRAHSLFAVQLDLHLTQIQEPLGVCEGAAVVWSEACAPLVPPGPVQLFEEGARLYFPIMRRI